MAPPDDEGGKRFAGKSLITLARDEELGTQLEILFKQVEEIHQAARFTTAAIEEIRRAVGLDPTA